MKSSDRMTPRGTPILGGRVKVGASASRHISSGAIPRIDDATQARAMQEIHVMLVGPPADAQNEVAELLCHL